MGKPNWDDWQFLLGKWIGEGGGSPGQGEGGLSFCFDLQEQVLLRKNHVEFTATSDRPAFTHDDLTIFFQDLHEDTRAIYFDNEGHVTYNSVVTTKEGIIMTSDPGSIPRTRTTLLTGINGTFITRFEIAPPENPEAFVIYVEGKARRV